MASGVSKPLTGAVIQSQLNTTEILNLFFSDKPHNSLNNVLFVFLKKHFFLFFFLSENYQRELSLTRNSLAPTSWFTSPTVENLAWCAVLLKNTDEAGQQHCKRCSRPINKIYSRKLWSRIKIYHWSCHSSFMVPPVLLLYVLTVFEIKSEFPSSLLEFETGMPSPQIRFPS